MHLLKLFFVFSVSHCLQKRQPESQEVQQLKNAAIEEASKEANMENQYNEMVSKAEELIRERISRYYRGSSEATTCFRDFSNSCPNGWEETASQNTCAPPETYDGVCEPSAFSRLNDSGKESISVKCGVEWPCVATCHRDFSACPIGWTAGDKGCASLTLDDICGPFFDFSNLTPVDKAKWASRCNAAWPCKQ